MVSEYKWHEAIIYGVLGCVRKKLNGVEWSLYTSHYNSFLNKINNVGYIYVFFGNHVHQQQQSLVIYTTRAKTLAQTKTHKIIHKFAIW